jgi:N-acetylneuraminic acid mutarotase
MISFGGEAYNEKTKKTVTTDQVMVLDTEIMLWYPPSVSGQVPTGRSGHTASMLQNQLLVFGGVKNNKWQKSLAVLDTMRWMWSVPKVAGDAPRARSYHSATPVPDSNLLVIFGGNNETECFNSVHVLDTKSEKWSWFHPVVSGTAPCARTGHVAVLLEDGKTILVYGGWDPNVDEDVDNGDAVMSDEDYIFGDSFLLNTETWTWKPGPKPKFATDQVGIVNGGLKRVGASSILAPGDDMSQMLVFGGRITNDRFSNDFQGTTVPQRMMGM